MLGRDLSEYLKAKGYEVATPSSAGFNLLGNYTELFEQVALFQPDIILHAAAYTQVDKAESAPELAMSINKDGTHTLVQMAKALDCIFVYISTDYVFDGAQNTPYLSSDRPNPISIYGKSKYYGELAVQEHLEMYYIVRTSWLYGQYGHNFVQFVLEAARQGREIPVVQDWIGSPTWTGSLCAMIENIMTSGAFGIYHAADAGSVSRFDQAVQICRNAGLSVDHIRPVLGSTFSAPAKRPSYSVLDPTPLVVPTWETSLQGYLQQYLMGQTG